MDIYINISLYIYIYHYIYKSLSIILEVLFLQNKMNPLVSMDYLEVIVGVPMTIKDKGKNCRMRREIEKNQT